MTTVAYRDGVMASDSCIQNNKLITSSVTKIFRTSAGALIGTAGDGDVREALTLLDKCKTPASLPTRAQLAALKADFYFIMVFPKGDVWLIQSAPGGNDNDNLDHFMAMCWPANRGFIAIGSGGDLAIGAMAAGKTAAEAVNIACKWDTGSRTPVYSVPLVQTTKPPKPKPK